MKAKIPYKKTKRRVGRGTGCTKGKTCGRGHKGQLARSGAKSRHYSEGGQNSIIRRLPKRGFNRPQKVSYDIVNVSVLAGLSKSEVAPEDLMQAGYVKRIERGIKILGVGDLSKAVTVKAHAFSESARQKIEKAGGKVILIGSEKDSVAAVQPQA